MSTSTGLFHRLVPCLGRPLPRREVVGRNIYGQPVSWQTVSRCPACGRLAAGVHVVAVPDLPEAGGADEGWDL